MTNEDFIQALEPVNHPKHYNKGIECWDYVISHSMDFMTGNVIKYMTRWKDKNGIQDLKKARAYIDKMLEIYGDETHKPEKNTICNCS